MAQAVGHQRVIPEDRVLLRYQGPERMPWSIWPGCTAAYKAYCTTIIPPPPRDLDFPISAARCLHVHTTREILAAKGGTVDENVGQ
jgi:hypothetical protein